VLIEISASPRRWPIFIDRCLTRAYTYGTLLNGSMSRFPRAIRGPSRASQCTREHRASFVSIENRMHVGSVFSPCEPLCARGILCRRGLLRLLANQREASRLIRTVRGSEPLQIQALEERRYWP
jgi:hypothetical protein